MDCVSTLSNSFLCCPEYPYINPIHPVTRLFISFKQMSQYVVHQNPLKVSVAILSIFSLVRSIPVLNKYSSIINFIGISILLKIAKEWRHVPLSLTISPFLMDYFKCDLRTGMNKERYTTRECSLNGRSIARLYYVYQDDRMIPFLQTTTTNPFEKGFAKGLLQGNEITQVFLHALRPMKTLLAIEGGDMSRSRIRQNTSNLTFFPEHIRELEGIVEGLKEYSRRTGHSCNVTLKDLQSVLAIPDTYKHILVSLACSTIIAKQGDKITIGRNLDWISFSFLGKYMNVSIEEGISRKTKKPWRVESLTFPGYIGNLTVTNGTLILIVNECNRITHCSGMPYSLFLKELIQEATTVDEVEQLIKEWARTSERLLPASSFHLIAADTKGIATVFQFYADKRSLYIDRSCRDNEILIVTNHAVDRDNRVIPGTGNKASELRAELMKEAYFKDRGPRLSTEDRIKRALQPHPVNSKSTIGSVIYSPGKLPQYAFDECHAATYFKG